MRSTFTLADPRRVPFAAIAILAAALAFPRAVPAATNAASLLKAGDVAGLLGGTPTVKATPAGKTCTWTGTKPGHRLLILSAELKGVPPEAAFMGARKNAQAMEDSKISDESGLGERAFSGEVSFGAVFLILKQGRMLQLQYWTGGHGTSQDVAALRPLARKAAAAF